MNDKKKKNTRHGCGQHRWPCGSGGGRRHSRRCSPRRRRGQRRSPRRGQSRASRPARRRAPRGCWRPSARRISADAIVIADTISGPTLRVYGTSCMFSTMTASTPQLWYSCASATALATMCARSPLYLGVPGSASRCTMPMMPWFRNAGVLIVHEFGGVVQKEKKGMRKRERKRVSQSKEKERTKNEKGRKE